VEGVVRGDGSNEFGVDVESVHGGLCADALTRESNHGLDVIQYLQGLLTRRPTIIP
jgi:hypothetical protein